MAYGSANVAYSPWLANGISADAWLFIVDDVGPLGSSGYLQPALDAARGWRHGVRAQREATLTQGLVHSGIVLQGEAGASIKAPGGRKDVHDRRVIEHVRPDSAARTVARW